MEVRIPKQNHYMKNQLKKPFDWKIWYRLLRPHTLTASFIPVSIGTVLSLQEGRINLLLFLAMLIASMLIQSATNMFNEYYDYKRGLDTAESVGIGGTIVREGIAPKTVLNLAFSFFGISVLLGIYICLESSWWIAAIGIVCLITGYLYTGGPYPIAHTPFGELVSGFFMGFIIIGISYYIQTGLISLESMLMSLPSFILIGAIMMSNNIRDLDGDKAHGRRTLAILLGREKAIGFLAGMFTVSFIWIITLMIFQIVSPWLLIVFLSLPMALKAIKGFRQNTQPATMMPAMVLTAKTNTFFGFLVAIGLLLGHYL